MSELVENKVYAFLADDVVFDVKYMAASFSVSESIFNNHTKNTVLVKAPEGVDVRSGWSYSNGELSNTDGIEESDSVDADAARFAFIETETNKVYLVLHCEASSKLAATYNAALESEITVRDITGVEGVVIGSTYDNGNYIDPA